MLPTKHFWSQNGICHNEGILQEYDISAELRHNSDGAFSDYISTCWATLVLAH